MKRRQGFTLLEVIVALVLMGSIFAGSLLAFSRHRQQLRSAEKRIEATMIADQLVTQLSSQRGGLPIGTRGRIPGKRNWAWQTSSIGTTTLARVPLRIVRFQIVELGPVPTQLVSVQIVEPSETP